MPRRLKHSLIAIGSLVVLLTGATAFVAATNTGLRFVLAEALPANVRVARVDGTLLGPFTLHDVRAASDSVRVRIASVTVDWSAARLFAATLDIKRLALDGVRVTRLPKAAPAPAKQPPRLRLPLAIDIDSLQIDDAAFYTRPGAQPLVLTAARLSGHYDNRRLVLRHVQAHGPMFKISGRAGIVPVGAYPVVAQFDWSLHLPDYAPANGAMSARGTLAALRIHASAAAPYNIVAEIDAALRDTPVRFDARVTMQDAPLHAIHGTWPQTKVSAKASTRGSADKLDYTLTASAAGTALGALQAQLRGSYANKVAQIESLRLTGPGAATVDGRGSIDLNAAAPTLAFNLDWRKLRWPHSEVASPRGTATLSGTLDNYKLAVDARMSAPRQTNGHLIVRGSGNRGSIALTRIDIEALQGELEGSGRAQWRPAVSGRIALTGSGLNPGLVVHGWPGKLALNLHVRAAPAGGGAAVMVDTFNVEGRLRGYPLKLVAAGNYGNKTLSIDKLSLRSGTSRIDAHGRIGPQRQALAWQIESSDLASLWPGAGGSLDGHGSVAGTRTEPHVQAELKGSDIHAAFGGKSYRANSLAVHADVDLAGAQPSHVDASWQGGAAAGIGIAAITLKAAGTPAAHDLRLTAATDRGRADVAVTGHYKNRLWRFDLAKATLAYPDLAPWQLAAASGGEVSSAGFAIDRSCWQSGGARLCLHAQRDDNVSRGTFTLTQLPAAYFAPLLPDDIAISGTFSGNGNFARRGDGTPDIHVEIDTTAGKLASVQSAGDTNPASRAPLRQAEQSTTVLSFAPSRLILTSNSAGLDLDAGLKLAGSGGLDLRAHIPGGTRPLIDRPLAGRVTASVPDIAFVGRLLPGVSRVTGRIDGTLDISGSLAAPALQGRLALRGGSARLRAPGVQLTGIEASLTGRPDGSIAVDAAAQSGGGRLGITGAINLVRQPRHAELAVRGSDFEIFHTVNGHVFASPDLAVKLTGTNLDVTGSVTVPKANITPEQIPATAVTASEDQVIVTPGKQRQSRLVQQLNAQILLTLGEKVHFKGFGLSGRIGGELTISEKGGEPPHANGELHIVDGEYRAYGQGLVIQTGRLLFAGGPVDEPGLDVRAVRHPAENITVGIEASGTLKRPDFQLFSDPAMPQAEQLSWLVLGRPLNNTSQQQGSALSRLALSLGINQSNSIASTIGKNLGVDTFAIQTGSQEPGSAQNTEEAALVIGKYLSPRLYISYGIGLFQPINTVRLEYTLSSRWKLATESSSVASGGDLIYTLESQ